MLTNVILFEQLWITKKDSIKCKTFAIGNMRSMSTLTNPYNTSHALRAGSTISHHYYCSSHVHVPYLTTNSDSIDLEISTPQRLQSSARMHLHRCSQRSPSPTPSRYWIIILSVLLAFCGAFFLAIFLLTNHILSYEDPGEVLLGYVVVYRYHITLSSIWAIPASRTWETIYQHNALYRRRRRRRRHSCANPVKRMTEKIVLNAFFPLLP